MSILPVFSRPTVTLGMRLFLSERDLKAACLSARWVSEGANTHSTTHSALFTARHHPGGEAELGQDVLHVVFGGSLRDHQSGGDLVVAATGSDQPGHLGLGQRGRLPVAGSEQWYEYLSPRCPARPAVMLAT